MPTRASAIPRRVIKLAYHWPPTPRELEALYYLARMPARAVLYSGGNPQPVANTMALGAVTSVEIVGGGRILVHCQWTGIDEVPEMLLSADKEPVPVADVLGFEKEPPKRRQATYSGIGAKPDLR